MFEAKSSIVLPQQAIKEGTGTELKKKLLEQTRDKLGKLSAHVVSQVKCHPKSKSLLYRYQSSI